MKHVLIIDDSEMVIELLRSALEAEGIRVSACLEPDRTMVTGEDPPDLILLDINMPQYFGDDVAGFFREAWGVESPIFLFSDIAEEELKQRAQDAGVEGYVWKGWGIERVVEAILNHLEGGGGGVAEEFFEKFRKNCLTRRDTLKTSSLETLRLEAHATAGEAGLLDLTTIAQAASKLEARLRELQSENAEEAALEEVRSQFDRLLSAAIRAAETGDDTAVAAELEDLGEEPSPAGAGASWFAAPEGIEQPTRGRRVLLLDDSEITREAFSGILADAGYQVADAGDLIEFEELVSNFEPEVILTDINMPDIQGDEICRVLKARLETEGIPIVLISSLPDEELALRAERVGADGYVSKQHGPERVVELLDELLSQIIF